MDTTKDSLKRIIRDLEQAIIVCYNVDTVQGTGDYDKTYPYATGYSRSAMQSAIIELKQVINK